MVNHSLQPANREASKANKGWPLTERNSKIKEITPLYPSIDIGETAETPGSDRSVPFPSYLCWLGCPGRMHAKEARQAGR